MTVKELYEWARRWDAENLQIGLQYQDGGGEFYGDTFSEGLGFTHDISPHKETTWFGEDYVLLR